MFTGIVQQLGTVRAMVPVEFGARLEIDPGAWAYRPERGASVAINGCCLTVAGEASGDASTPGGLTFDVVRQTLRSTTLGALVPGRRVNLESAVTPSTMLGGHIVQGHVDGVAVVRAVRRDAQEWRVRVEPPAELLECIVDRGSVALDGVSLTVAGLDGDTFEVALIPTTLAQTTLGLVDAGDRVNIETDYVAKTVVHWLRRRGV